MGILRFVEDRAKQIRSPYEEGKKKQLVLKFILFELYVCGYRHKHTHRITGEPNEYGVGLHWTYILVRESTEKQIDDYDFRCFKNIKSG